MQGIPNPAILLGAAGFHPVVASALAWWVLRYGFRLVIRGWRPVPLPALYGLAVPGGSAAMAVANAGSAGRSAGVRSAPGST